MTATTETVNVHGVKPGDLFVCSWGYDQTNVDVYEAVRVTRSSVALMKGHREIINGRVIPVGGDPIPFTRDGYNGAIDGTPNAAGEIMKRTTGGWQGEPWISINSFSGASRWDGERSFHDTYASGGQGH